MVTVRFYKTVHDSGTDKFLEEIKFDTREHALQFLTKKKYSIKGYGVYINRRNPKLYAVIG